MHDSLSMRDIAAIRDQYSYLIKVGRDFTRMGMTNTAQDYFEMCGTLRRIAPVDMYPEDIGMARKFADELTTAVEMRIVFTVAS